MKCPVCKDPDLVMTERQGVEIDYFPTCRGLWLDRGELDKIIEKSTSVGVARPEAFEVPRPAQVYGYYYEDRHHVDHDKYDSHHSRRRKSWLVKSLTDNTDPEIFGC
jgi:uncharacterized protein